MDPNLSKVNSNNNNSRSGRWMNGIRSGLKRIVKALTKHRHLKFAEFVHKVDSAKDDIAEQRIVVKESRRLQKTFGIEQLPLAEMHEDVAKLMFISLLGYQTNFAHMTMMGMAQSSLRASKRLGYMAIMLVINTLSPTAVAKLSDIMKRDLNSDVDYFVGWALCTVSVSRSVQLANNLAVDVARLFNSTKTYIRNKALVCACQMLRCDQKLTIVLQSELRLMIQRSDYADQISVITFLHTMCKQNAIFLAHFKQTQLDMLLQTLRQHMPDSQGRQRAACDIAISYQLQSQILSLLRLLCQNDREIADIIADDLRALFMSTSCNQRTAKMVLYEAAVCVLYNTSGPELHNMALQTLINFLISMDIELQLIALTALHNVMHVENDALQPFRTIIMDLLDVQNISIQRLAMKLTFALFTSEQLVPMTERMLTYLVSSQLKRECAAELLTTAERIEPNERWLLELSLCILTAAGNDLDDATAMHIMSIVRKSQLADRIFVTNTLWCAMQQSKVEMLPQPLVRIAVWCIGEYTEEFFYGDLEPDMRRPRVEMVLRKYRDLLLIPALPHLTIQYMLTSLIKLASTLDYAKPHIRALIRKFTNHEDTDIQQRAIEYDRLLDPAAKIFEQINFQRAMQ